MCSFHNHALRFEISLARESPFAICADHESRSDTMILAIRVRVGDIHPVLVLVDRRDCTSNSQLRDWIRRNDVPQAPFHDWLLEEYSLRVARITILEMAGQKISTAHLSQPVKDRKRSSNSHKPLYQVSRTACGANHDADLQQRCRA